MDVEIYTSPMRYIPTPVGNIVCRDVPTHTRAVHPHACGEHVTAQVRRDRELRFIPTPVGNMAYSSGFISIIPVHPHACGEHSNAIRYIAVESGSSPRLWGT